MKLINTKTHLIGELSMAKAKVKCETLGKEFEVDCLEVFVLNNGVLADILKYNKLKDLIKDGWVDYD